jgi:hypothetical protein
MGAVYRQTYTRALPLGWDEQDPDFHDPGMRIADAAISVSQMVHYALLGALFLSVRSRSRRNWQPMFDTPTARS